MLNKSVATVLMIAFAHVQWASAQTARLQAVIIARPSQDTEVWRKITDRKSPIYTIEDLKKKFGDDEYAVVEGEDGRVFVFDRGYSPLRRSKIEEIALNAALRLCDSNGGFFYRDLTLDEKVAVGELFGSAFQVGIAAMGEGANNVKIGLGANLSLTAISDGREVRNTVSPRQDNDISNAHRRDLEAHGVKILPRTQEERDRRMREGMEETRDNYGMSVRFIGVHKKRQGHMVRLAMEAMYDLRQEERKRAESVHESLTDKLLLSHLEEFNGSFPDSLAKRQVPSRIWGLFESQLRYSPLLHGFESELDLERFLGSVTTVRLETSFLLTYNNAVPEGQPKRPGSGVRIEIRR